jgi:pimeloyl-ACP methyl ester carboxylesterase
VRKLNPALLYGAAPACKRKTTEASLFERRTTLRSRLKNGGDPKGPELVFIHGLGHSHLSWEKQYESSLAKDFRILTYDLRGHGDSGKPPEPEMYSEGKRWGDDLKVVISAAGLKKPTLVAWSLAGVVVLNYLHTHGGKDLSGVVFGGAIVGSKPEFFSSLDLFPPLYSDDLGERSRGIVNFVRACFSKQPDQNDFEVMLTYNGMVPAMMQRAVRKMVSRSERRPTTFVLTTLVTGLVIYRLFGPGQVTVHRVQGAIFVYLNVAVLFAIAFDLVETFCPGAIRSIAGGLIATVPAQRLAEFSYFSMTTITATGYGDLVPVHPFARSLAKPGGGIRSNLPWNVRRPFRGAPARAQG